MQKGPQPKKLDPKLPKFVSKEQEAKLLLALSLAKGKEGFSVDEALKILTWAEWTAFQWTMLQSILSGMIVPSVQTSNLDDYTDMTFIPTLKIIEPHAAFEYMQELNKAAEKVKNNKQKVE